MRAVITPHVFGGTVRVPASKSHTIRRLLIASLTDGLSEIDYPLDSLDARSCVSICRSMGAKIDETPDRWTIRGYKPLTKGNWGNPAEPKILDVGNSGTTLFLALSAAALGTEPFVFTGDEQIKRRSAGPLLEALSALGIRVEVKGENGCAPILIQGPWKGGRVSLPCPTSQYLSSLLLAAPLAPAGTVTEIDVPLLNERPYIALTLSYLDAQKIPYKTNDEFSFFHIDGGFSYKPLNGPVPGDFSSAAFPACAAAISGGNLSLLGLDPEDPQGDKLIFEILARMGCEITWTTGHKPGEKCLQLSRSGPLRGGEFDLNAVPDLLPVLAVTAAFAEGDTALVNAAHARIKETDRIAVMAAELEKLGVKCTERPDGLVIHGGGKVKGGIVDSHGDHRIVMAFAAAALAAQDPVEILGAEAARVTYPGFLDLL
ncbi:3-phosphoshikimate 1-carboxyvinyltransferase [Spirochaetia bacterium]|nr:3-phosphoshikimate 1-carboxyvinyltransferase [Spirochaetia bacterium]